jgi:hypothetical protein
MLTGWQGISLLILVVNIVLASLKQCDIYSVIVPGLLIIGIPSVVLRQLGDRLVLIGTLGLLQIFFSLNVSIGASMGSIIHFHLLVH